MNKQARNQRSKLASRKRKILRNLMGFFQNNSSLIHKEKDGIHKYRVTSGVSSKLLNCCHISFVKKCYPSPFNVIKILLKYALSSDRSKCFHCVETVRHLDRVRHLP